MVKFRKHISHGDGIVKMQDLVDSVFFEYDLAGKATYKKHSESRWNLHLKPFFGDRETTELTTRLQQEYQAKRRSEGAANATINREMMILAKAYASGSEAEPPLVDKKPKFKLLKEDNARKRFISSDEFEAIRKAANEEGRWARVFIEFAYFYGWRKSELLRLRVGDVNLKDRWVRLSASKNGEPREVPMTTNLVGWAKPLVEHRDPASQLFPVKDFKYAWKRICDRAGLKSGKEGIVLHDFRRTSAREKRSRGVAEGVIMQMQGWKTSAMFRRYAIVDSEDKMDALRRMERL